MASAWRDRGGICPGDTRRDAGIISMAIGARHELLRKIPAWMLLEIAKDEALVFEFGL